MDNSLIVGYVQHSVSDEVLKCFKETFLELLVGNKAVNAEDHTTICGEEELAYRRNKTEYAQRERERHKEYLY